MPSFFAVKFQFIELFLILCHSEPVRTLAWESPGLEGKCHTKQPKKLGDCHTSDIGHWFAMTRINPNLSRSRWGGSRPSPTDTLFVNCSRDLN